METHSVVVKNPRQEHMYTSKSTTICARERGCLQLVDILQNIISWRFMFPHRVKVTPEEVASMCQLVPQVAEPTCILLLRTLSCLAAFQQEWVCEVNVWGWCVCSPTEDNSVLSVMSFVTTVESPPQSKWIFSFFAQVTRCYAKSSTMLDVFWPILTAHVCNVYPSWLWSVQ